MGRIAIAATKSFRKDYSRMNKTDEPKKFEDYRFEYIENGTTGIDWIKAKSSESALRKYEKKHPYAKMITWGQFSKEEFKTIEIPKFIQI